MVIPSGMRQYLENQRALVDSLTKTRYIHLDLNDDLDLDLDLDLHWCPLRFLKEQYRSTTIKLANVIVIVGNATETYATTCLDYANQFWPTIGPEVINMLDEACDSAKTWTFALSSVDVHGRMKFALDFQFKHGTTEVCVKSLSISTLLEVSEVLCWLASTCRSSTTQDNALCLSTITGDRYGLTPT